MWLARTQKGYTQQFLADQLKVTQPRISSWESGNVTIPPARRTRLAEILDLSEDMLDQSITVK
jgi:transcriptional regulator with XRE-family HTH domain